MNDTGGVVTISDAARVLGVSVRTVQRRLDAGELEAQEVAGKRCVVLSRDTLGVVSPGASSDTKPPPDGVSSDTSTLKPARPSATTDTTRDTSALSRDTPKNTTAQQLDAPDDTPRDSSATIEAALRDALAREREQVAFLRAQVESHARAEAELRAALREALKLQARALPAPDAPTQAPADTPSAPVVPPTARPAAQRTPPRRRWRWPWE